MEIFGYKFSRYDDNDIYRYEDDKIVLLITLCEIGCVHPFIEYVSSTIWYNTEYGGLYIRGYDKIKRESFLPQFKNLN